MCARGAVAHSANRPQRPSLPLHVNLAAAAVGNPTEGMRGEHEPEPCPLPGTPKRALPEPLGTLTWHPWNLAVWTTLVRYCT